MIINFDDFLVSFLLKRENEQQDVFFDGGHNGLYNDPETPIRNTCHYMILYSYLYKKTNNEDYFKKLQSLEVYVLDNYYYGYSYECRNKENKDKSNGLIGTAWLSEGLLESYQITKNEKILKRLTSIYLKFNFDEKEGVWDTIVEPNGAILTMDRTLNHQIWFAAGLAKLLFFQDSNLLRIHLDLFISKLPKLIKFSNNGLIYHTLGISKQYLRTKIKRLIKPKYGKQMFVKEVGYQCFNLLGLLILDKYSNSSFLESNYIRKAILKMDDINFNNCLNNNKFAYPYNPVGIESAVIYSYFDREKVIEKLNKQFSETWSNVDFGFFNSTDYLTLNARFYEIIYLNPDFFSKLFFDIEQGKWCLNKKNI
jgi:hypothetical protein